MLPAPRIAGRLERMEQFWIGIVTEVSGNPDRNENEDISRSEKPFPAFPTDAESKLVDLLRANGKAIVSVAVEEAQVVGHIISVLFPPPR
jgi:UDP-N-acetylglucosamine enolpyruvyl transferase